MMHDEIADLLGAYALDALDPDEVDVVEEHLLSCARCRAEVGEHREVASLLAHSGADAPEGLWDRIAASLEEAPPKLDLGPMAAVRSIGEAPSAARRWRPSRIGTALSAAAALLIAFLGVQVQDQDQRIDELQLALVDPMTPAFESALADSGSQRFELLSADGEIVVLGAVTEDGRGFLRVKALPALSGDRTYQLWGTSGAALVSLGVLGDQPTYFSFEGRGYSAFAITEEVAPGVVQSQNAPVVAGSVTA